MMVINSMVCVFETLGNLLVCVAVVRCPSLRRTSKTLLFSLAVADLIVTVACEHLLVAILENTTFFTNCAVQLSRKMLDSWGSGMMVKASPT